ERSEGITAGSCGAWVSCGTNVLKIVCSVRVEVIVGIGGGTTDFCAKLERGIAFHPSQRFNPMETPHRKLVISSTPGSARRTTRGHCVTPSPDNWEVVIGI